MKFSHVNRILGNIGGKKASSVVREVKHANITTIKKKLDCQPFVIDENIVYSITQEGSGRFVPSIRTSFAPHQKFV